MLTAARVARPPARPLPARRRAVHLGGAARGEEL